MGNLSFDCDERSLRKFFEKERLKVSRVNIGKDENNKSRGFAFVEFENESSLSSAIKLNNQTLEGRSLRINNANQRPSK